jgi:hypothetical protein
MIAYKQAHQEAIWSSDIPIILGKSDDKSYTKLLDEKIGFNLDLENSDYGITPEIMNYKMDEMMVNILDKQFIRTKVFIREYITEYGRCEIRTEGWDFRNGEYFYFLGSEIEARIFSWVANINEFERIEYTNKDYIKIPFINTNFPSVLPLLKPCDIFWQKVLKGRECKVKLEEYQAKKWWDKWDIKLKELFSLYPDSESSMAYRKLIIEGRKLKSGENIDVIGDISDWKQVKRIQNVKHVISEFKKILALEENRMIKSICYKNSNVMTFGELGSIEVKEIEGKMELLIKDFNEEVNEEVLLSVSTMRNEEFAIFVNKFVGERIAAPILTKLNNKL